MSSLPAVTLVGATGNIGSVILGKLLEAGFPVVILTRQGSTSTSKLPKHPNQTIKEADYSSKDSLTAAIKGSQVLISTVTSGKTGEQNILVDAALESGTVTRIVPSVFCSDFFHPDNINLPVYAGKLATARYIEELAAKHPQFTYTNIMNNLFFDWSLRNGFTVNVKSHTATLWNGGDMPYSTTTLNTVGNAVVAVLKNLDGTANKTLKIHDAVVTQNQLIAIVKKIDGKDWQTTSKTSQTAEEEGYAELKKPEPNYGKAMPSFLIPAIYGPGRDVFASQVDNEFLGLRTMNAAEVEEIVRKIVQEVQG